MATVYVKWYGKVLEGEMLDSDYLGMKQVVIPLDRHHPIAMFTPGHVYDSPEKVEANSPMISPNSPRSFPELPEKEQISAMSDVMLVDDQEMIETFKRENWDAERGHLRIDKLDEFYQLWRMVMTPADFVEAEAPVTLPSHKEVPVSAEASKRIVSDERMEELKQQLKEVLNQQPKKRMRCYNCQHLDYDYISDCKEIVKPNEHFCGLHGRTRVDPNGEQVNLDHKGGCGFLAASTPKPSKKMLRSTGVQVFVDSTQLALFELVRKINY